MDVRVGPLRRLSAEELMLLNCGAGGRLFRVPWTARRPNQSILKEINPEWIFIGRTDAEDEATIVWPPDVKNWLIGKDPNTGKDWGQEEKGATKDEMAWWHQQLNGHESEQTPGDGEGWGSPVCCNPSGHSVRHGLVTERQQHLFPPSISSVVCRFSLSHFTFPGKVGTSSSSWPWMADLSLPHVALTSSTTSIPRVLLIPHLRKFSPTSPSKWQIACNSVSLLL